MYSGTARARDDPVIRRRVAQKVEFLAQELTPATPTDAELQAWLDQHAADYRVDARYSFTQVYFDPSRHGAELEADLDKAQRLLAKGRPIPSQPLSEFCPAHPGLGCSTPARDGEPLT